MSSNSKCTGPEGPTVIPSPKRRRILKLIGLGGVASLAGCMGDNGSVDQTDDSKYGDNQQRDAGTPSRGGDFIVGQQADAADLNPLQIDEEITSDAVSQMFDAGWLRTGSKPEDIAPRWFESWNISDSYDVVEVELRDNLRYGDEWGQLTAEDYIYNIENVWTSDWYPYSFGPQFNVGTNDQPVKYEKTGKYTIREELPTPRPFWPYNDPISFSIPVPRKILEPYVEKKDAKGLDKDPAVLKSQFSGNLGPWSLREWKRQSVIVYERNDEYYLRKWAKKDDRIESVWAEAPYLDTLSIQLFGEPSTMRSALKSGEIQMAGIPPTKLDNFKGRNDITLFKDPFVAFSSYAQMNLRANGWQGLRNKKVRWAMANLYDRNFVVEKILSGKGETQGTLYPSWGPYYPKNKVKTFEWTVDKAKQLLKEGTSSDYGYSGDKFVGPNGNQLDLKCIYTSDTITDLQAQYLKKRLGEAGIKVTLETTNWSNLLSNYYEAKYPAKGESKPIGYGPDGKQHPSSYNYGPWDKAVTKQSWDLMLGLGTTNGPVDPAGTVASVYAERGQFNSNGFVPEKDFKKLRKKAMTTSSREKAKGTIEEMLVSLSRAQPTIFQSNSHSFTGYRKKIKGLPANPAESYWVNQNWDHYYYG
ncbi:ABC transporter substrate-binding protein [Halocatena marina]|uniref:ABC transporter substrate-binding protein n=1 Tax=Halocatena marina TaxID=2934937 RepID=UPI00200E1A00|nr:ABC transporter substrate-binding protein [Halocatena marina]